MQRLRTVVASHTISYAEPATMMTTQPEEDEPAWESMPFVLSRAGRRRKKKRTSIRPCQLSFASNRDEGLSEVEEKVSIDPTFDKADPGGDLY